MTGGVIFPFPHMKTSEVNRFFEENGSSHRVVPGEIFTFEDYVAIQEVLIRKVFSEREVE